MLGNKLLALRERVGDAYYGIKTWGYHTPADLGLPADCHEYTPVPYSCLRAMFRAVPDSLRSGTLIDFGCGMGRVVVVGSRFFRRVVGVEYSERLVQIAEANCKRCRSEVHIIHGDAGTLAIPDDATVFFFANPFSGEPMRRTLTNIRESLNRVPRDHRFLVYNASAFRSGCEEISWGMKRVNSDPARFFSYVSVEQSIGAVKIT